MITALQARTRQAEAQAKMTEKTVATLMQQVDAAINTASAEGQSIISLDISKIPNTIRAACARAVQKTLKNNGFTTRRDSMHGDYELPGYDEIIIRW